MKNIYPGYCKKTDDEIKKIWENGLIIFDTNVLLNLYRYSDATRNTILDLIAKFKSQIFLPHQAGLEYNRNRYEVIAEQDKAYKEFLDKISQIQKDLQSTNKPPFLSQQIDQDLNAVFEKVSSEVQESIKKYSDYLKDDPTYNKLSELFENKISKPFTNEKLEDIYKEGEERYKMKIPPGFEDEKTKEGNRKFGDLVLWKQVIEIAQNLKKDIILITDERKIDWWWKIKDGRNMGPRQELVEEIKKLADVDFHMYSSERFLSYGQSFLKEQINQQALDEIQAMKKAEMEQIRKSRIREYKENEININDNATFLQSRIEELNKRKYLINSQKRSILNNNLDDPGITQMINNYSKRETELEEEINLLLNQIESSQKFINKMNDNNGESSSDIRKRMWKYLNNQNNSDSDKL